MKLLQDVGLLVLKNYLNKAVRSVYSRCKIINTSTTGQQQQLMQRDTNNMMNANNTAIGYECIIEGNECYEEEFDSFEEYNELLGR